jgi:hypothetical protein
MTIEELQEYVKKAWTNESYSPEFNGSGIAHKDFGHALVHVTKAAGKLAAIVDDADHGKPCQDDPGKYLADLLICAARAANAQGINLASVLNLRLVSKLPIYTRTP